MRRWIGLAAGLYPRYWRERYGEEFDALIEDHRPGWREFSDVLRGAVQMQMTNAASYWKLAVGLALVGAIAAMAVSFSAPNRYVSTAVMRMTPLVVHGDSQDWQAEVSRHINENEQLMLSRTSLETLIVRPDLNLYRDERNRMPMEDVIQQMRQRDIQVRTLPVAAGKYGMAFDISFTYPDQKKAQAVVRNIVTQFEEWNVQEQRIRAQFWKDQARQSPPPPSGESLEVLDPPTLPEKPISANRLSYVAWGLASGLMLGLLAAVAIRHPKWTLQMASFGMGCCVLGFAIPLLFPKTYTSTCVMRMTPAMVSSSIPATPLAKKLAKLETQVLSDAGLQAIAQREGLYRNAGATDILGRMRKDLRIEMLRLPGGEPDAGDAFSIAFTYPDRHKAQAVVRATVSGFTEQNVTNARAQARTLDRFAIDIEEHKIGENLEVLDPPSDPQRPDGPNRLAISLAGLASGLLLGAVTLRFRQHRNPALQTA